MHAVCRIIKTFARPNFTKARSCFQVVEDVGLRADVEESFGQVGDDARFLAARAA